MDKLDLEINAVLIHCQLSRKHGSHLENSMHCGCESLKGTHLTQCPIHIHNHGKKSCDNLFSVNGIATKDSTPSCGSGGIRTGVL